LTSSKGAAKPKPKAPAKAKAPRASAFKPPTLTDVKALYAGMQAALKDSLDLRERFGTLARLKDTLARLRQKYPFSAWPAIAAFEARFAAPAAARAGAAAAAAAPPALPAKPPLSKQKPQKRKPVAKAKKPIIYLYPRAACSATVRLRLASGLRFTSLLPRPEAGSARGSATWRVAAAPDGTLAPPSGPPVASLFWEAAVSGAREASMLPEGARDTFCVRGDDAGGWLLGALRAWGLTPREVRCSPPPAALLPLFCQCLL
jgi:hypothetical protein